LLGGEISVMFATLPSVLTLVKAGKLSLLAVLSPQRSAAMPDLPTIAELGFQGVRAEITQGFVVPAATPHAIVERLNAELVKALNAPESKAKLGSLDVDVVAGTPEQFGEQIRRDQELYARLVREIKLKID